MEVNKLILSNHNPEENRCILCGHASRVLFSKIEDRLFSVPGEWGHRQCQNCHLIWLVPRPGEESIMSFYEDYYTHAEYAENKSFIYKALRWVFHFAKGLFQNADKKNLELLDLSSARPGKMLEIGVGNGERLRQFKNQGWNVLGQELDPKAAAFAAQRTGFEILRGPVEELNLPSETFDCIIMNHVLEHLPEPVSTFKHLHRALKLGGVLAVGVPNGESLTFARFQSDWIHLDPPRHLFIYSIQNLKLLGMNAGFEMKHSRSSQSGLKFAVRGSLGVQKFKKFTLGQFLPWREELQVWWICLALRQPWWGKPRPGDDLVVHFRKV